MNQSQRDELLKLVTERHRLEDRIEAINDAIDDILTGDTAQPTLPGLVFESLLDGEKPLGSIITYVLERGYRENGKPCDAAAVRQALADLVALSAVTAVTKDSNRIYHAAAITPAEVQIKLLDRYGAEPART